MVFTSTATYAQSALHLWINPLLRVVVIGNKLDGTGRTMRFAIAAGDAVLVHDADILVEYCETDTRTLLLVEGQRLDSVIRTDLAAQCAVIVAISPRKIHHRLHHTVNAIFIDCRTQNLVRTFADAQVTGRAVPVQMFVAL